ncbi:hypothetical protein OJAV_G00219230 [Oryzias javanicus]|uniref:L-methionine (R)-S-oxide reductase n=1 Tax=Oryzias javanicus TaxID=123683 RepID=A0A437C0H8_ORYJA|nr:hypothetical protein OJAV_G00219230 [Oryzias javanicus]
MHRVEATCSQCGAHLGHLFDDAPRPTGKRDTVLHNSASLDFQPKTQTPPGRRRWSGRRSRVTGKRSSERVQTNIRSCSSAHKVCSSHQVFLEHQSCRE